MTETQDRDYRAEAVALATRDYPFEVRKTEYDTYFLSVPDIPGCTTEGETLEEALGLLDDAKVTWIAAALRNGKVVPNPRDVDAFSGKFVTRIGKSTHRRVAAAARRDGVSLNAWVMEAVNFRLGYSESERTTPVPATRAETKVVVSQASWTSDRPRTRRSRRHAPNM